MDGEGLSFFGVAPIHSLFTEGIYAIEEAGLLACGSLRFSPSQTKVQWLPEKHSPLTVAGTTRDFHPVPLRRASLGPDYPFKLDIQF